MTISKPRTPAGRSSASAGWSTRFAVSPRIPPTHLPAGFGYALSPASSVDFAWSHAFQESMDNAGLPNTSAPIRVSHAQDNATLVYTYRF